MRKRDKIRVGMRVRLKKNDEILRKFPDRLDEGATVLGIRNLPHAFYVRFDYHKKSEVWSPEYFTRLTL